MQTTRINNFSLFVTVLSACLGLLAVGTPAQVYAQQAVNASRSSSSLIGRCDEDAPQVEELLNLNTYFHANKDFISDLSRLVSIGKYTPGDYEHVDISFEIPKERGTMRTSASGGNRWLRVAAEDAVDKLVFAFEDSNIFYRYEDEWKLDVAHFDVAYHLDASGIGINTTQEQKSFEQAQKLAVNYNASFLYQACHKQDELERSFYENTHALVENNKILIITRLPRAALDELLAELPETD